MNPAAPCVCACLCFNSPWSGLAPLTYFQNFSQLEWTVNVLTPLSVSEKKILVEIKDFPFAPQFPFDYNIRDYPPVVISKLSKEVGGHIVERERNDTQLRVSRQIWICNTVSQITVSQNTSSSVNFFPLFPHFFFFQVSFHLRRVSLITIYADNYRPSVPNCLHLVGLFYIKTAEHMFTVS